MGEIKIDIPEPNEKQKLFLADQHRHVAYGGARGGGKSWAVRVKAILLCLNWPGIKILIVRKTYKELTNNHIVPLQQMIPPEVARYNKTDKVFTFVNGSTIWFGYCNNDSDLDQYQGAEYDVIFFDEATQLQESWIKKIRTDCRSEPTTPAIRAAFPTTTSSASSLIANMRRPRSRRTTHLPRRSSQTIMC